MNLILADMINDPSSLCEGKKQLLQKYYFSKTSRDTLLIESVAQHYNNLNIKYGLTISSTSNLDRL